MTTSASIDFTLTRNEIITEALEQIGAIGIGDTLQDSDVTTCSRSLNLMVKAWNGQGIHLWTASEMSVTLVGGQADYTLSPRPLHVKQIRVRNEDDIDRPVRIDSRNDFYSIANKTAEGQTNRAYYDPQLNSGTLSIWPTPPDDTTDVLKITYYRSLEDFDASGDNPDFPQEWLEAISLNLAIRIAPKYGKSLAKVNPDLKENALMALMEMRLWDTEAARVSVVPARDYSE